jgi:hypothetical protein
VVVIASTVVILAIAAPLEGPASVDQPGETTVELPAVDELETPRMVAEPPPTVGCEPEGCLLWWSDEVDHRPVVVTGDLLVHDGRDELIALDARTGQVVWRHDHPETRPGPSFPQTRDAMLLDEDGLVLARGDHLWFREPGSGEMTSEIHVEGANLHQLERLGDGVLAIGTDSTSPPHRGVLARISDRDRGVIQWRRTVGAVVGMVPSPPSPTGTVVVRVDGAVIGLGVSDGGERWRLDRSEPQAVLAESRLAVRGSDEQEVELVDPTTGEVLRRLRFDHGVRALSTAGRMLVVVAGDWTHVVDPDSYRQLDARDVSGSVPAPAGAQVERRTVVLWPTGDHRDGRELAIYGPVGGTVQLIELTIDTDVRPWPAQDRVDDIGDHAVRIVLADQQVIFVDVERGQVLRSLSPSNGWTTPEDDLDPLREIAVETVSVHGTMVALRAASSVRLVTLDGSIELRGATRIASVDPLIVHGGLGAVRLEDELADRSR